MGSSRGSCSGHDDGDGGLSRTWVTTWRLARNCIRLGVVAEGKADGATWSDVASSWTMASTAILDQVPCETLQAASPTLCP